MQYLKTSFEPLAGKDARVLILGSIPGDRSIELGQYYGHPQNRFWRMIAAVCKEAVPDTYLRKKDLLQCHRIALWDVAHTAVRPGSMDHAIRDEAPNDIAGLIASLPDLHTVAFNGKKAEQLYDKYFERFSHLRYLSMPSTSPANAACRLEELCRQWVRIWLVR